MSDTMRLQVRVTPANKELLEHLETFDKDYRGKRLIALASLALSLQESRLPSSESSGTTFVELKKSPVDDVCAIAKQPKKFNTSEWGANAKK